MGFGAMGGEEEDGDDVVEEAGRWGEAPARTSSGRRQAQSERRRGAAWLGEAVGEEVEEVGVGRRRGADGRGGGLRVLVVGRGQARATALAYRRWAGRCAPGPKWPRSRWCGVRACFF